MLARAFLSPESHPLLPLRGALMAASCLSTTFSVHATTYLRRLWTHRRADERVPDLLSAVHALRPMFSLTVRHFGSSASSDVRASTTFSERETRRGGFAWIFGEETIGLTTAVQQFHDPAQRQHTRSAFWGGAGRQFGAAVRARKSRRTEAEPAAAGVSRSEAVSVARERLLRRRLEPCASRWACRAAERSRDPAVAGGEESLPNGFSPAEAGHYCTRKRGTE